MALTHLKLSEGFGHEGSRLPPKSPRAGNQPARTPSIAGPAVRPGVMIETPQQRPATRPGGRSRGARLMPRQETRSLFGDPDDAREDAAKVDAPLAERMRPRTLEEFVGQAHLVGAGRLIRRLIEDGGRLPSLILWGGPGTGKTTLARLLAHRAGARFAPLSAVLSGVKELRDAIAEARQERRRGRRTVLFIDEIHRFNKAQQDALLPAVEDGTVTLIGATTENPSFEVNAALLSRARVLTLEPLTEGDVAPILRRALADSERGLACARAGGRRRRPGPPGPRLRGRRPRGTDGPGILNEGHRARARRRAPRGPGDADRGPGPDAVRLRQGGRGALQSDLRPDQVVAQLRRERRALLAGPADRGGRRPRLHRAAALHPRVRGRRPGRPPGDGPGGRRGADRRT